MTTEFGDGLNPYAWFSERNSRLGLEIVSVRVDEKLIGYADYLYKHETRRYVGAKPIESLCREVVRLVEDRGGDNGIGAIAVRGAELPEDLPHECIRLSFKAAAGELLMVIECMMQEKPIASTMIAFSDHDLRNALVDYQQCMLEADVDGRPLLGRGRRSAHEKAIRQLFDCLVHNFHIPTDTGYVSLGYLTKRNIVSVLGFLFPKGPAQGWLSELGDELKAPPRPGLKYEEGYAVFDAPSFSRLFEATIG